MRSDRRGFTLIELMVVISIIGVLAVLMLVGLRTMRYRAQDVQRKSDITSLNRALISYRAEHGEKHPVSLGELLGFDSYKDDFDRPWVFGYDIYDLIPSTFSRVPAGEYELELYCFDRAGNVSDEYYIPSIVVIGKEGEDIELPIPPPNRLTRAISSQHEFTWVHWGDNIGVTNYHIEVARTNGYEATTIFEKDYGLKIETEAFDIDRTGGYEYILLVSVDDAAGTANIYL